MRATELLLDEIPANYHAYTRGAGRPIIEAFSDPAMYDRLRTAALAGIPGAFGAIELAERRMREADPGAKWDDRSKKFLGFCAAVFWRKCGHHTAGVKRRMPHPSFSRGEVYVVDDYEPLPLSPRSSLVEAETETEDVLA